MSQQLNNCENTEVNTFFLWTAFYHKLKLQKIVSSPQASEKLKSRFHFAADSPLFDLLESIYRTIVRLVSVSLQGADDVTLHNLLIDDGEAQGFQLPWA